MRVLVNANAAKVLDLLKPSIDFSSSFFTKYEKFYSIGDQVVLKRLHQTTWRPGKKVAEADRLI